MRILVVYLSIALGARAGLAQTWSTQVSTTDKTLNAVAILSANDMVAVGNKVPPGPAEFVIRYSTNGGTTWNTPNAPGAPVKSMNAVDFSGDNVVAVGDGGTVAYSINKGAEFSISVDPDIPNKELKAVAFITATTVVATGAKNGANYTMIRSTDGGANWANVTPGGGKDLNAIAFNGANAIAVGERSGAGVGEFTIIRSDGSGDDWTDPVSLVPVVIGGQHLNAVTFVNPTTLVAVGNSGAILTSTNTGATWGNEAAGLTGQDLNAVIAFGTIVVAVGNSGTTLRSTDSGDNWSVVAAGLTGQNLNAIDAGSSLMVAVGNNGAILTSANSGSTWTSETSGTGNDLFGVAILNPVIAVGAGGTILLRTESSAAAGGIGPSNIGGGVAVPFEGEWLALVLIVGLGLYRLRRSR